MLAPWKKSCDNPRQCIKKQRHPFADEGPSSQSYGFSSSHLKIWELDQKKKKKAEDQRTDAFELWCWRRLLDSKEIKPVNPKGNQSWIFVGRTDADGWSWNSQCFGYLMRTNSLEKILMLVKIEGRRKREGVGDIGWNGWMASSTQCTRVWANSGRL